MREFRSVATLTAAQLVTAWTHVSLALGEARDTAERQLAAEQRKKGGGKVGVPVAGQHAPSAGQAGLQQLIPLGGRCC